MIVSTPEQEHTKPILQALKLGKPVLVEKPIGFSLAEADTILETLRETKGNLRVGYSRRYKECFLRAKEQMLQGRLGKVVGGTARVYNSRAQAFSILKRDPHATPVLDVLTYYVDLMCWFLEGNRPVEVVARGQHGIFKEAGYGAHDVTWAIVTFADGAVINFGVSYALPANYPTLGQSDRVELLGTEGTMIIDDDHMDHLLYSEKGIPHAYVPDHSVNMAFLGSNTAGDWAVGDFWGPLGNETRAWLDSSRHRRADRPHHARAGAHQSGNHHRDRARGGDRPVGAAAAAVGSSEVQRDRGDRRRRRVDALLVVGVGMPAEHGEHDEEADHIGDGDVPAVAQPEPDRFRLRIHVGQRDAGRRAEPDHRAAEADRIGEIAPVVAALLQGERGERDVVEHRRDEAEARARSARTRAAVARPASSRRR